MWIMADHLSRHRFNRHPLYLHAYYALVSFDSNCTTNYVGNLNWIKLALRLLR